MSRDFYISVVFVTFFLAGAFTICFTTYSYNATLPSRMAHCQTVARNTDEFISCVQPAQFRTDGSTRGT